MSDDIVHTPYDLGLGVDVGDKREVAVSENCHVRFYRSRLTLIWEVKGAPKPFLVVNFEDVEVVRVLEETWLSTETKSDRRRGIDGSFARIVEGSEYPTPLGLMKEIAGPVVHYLFVTGFDCVDVIARDTPRAEFADHTDLSKHYLELPLCR